MRKFFSSFTFLNITQLLAALNDNLYKLLLVFFLISLQGAERSNTILSLVGVVFVVPFLLFAALAGSLADRWSKRSIIYVTRLIGILTTLLGVLAFFFHSIYGAYTVLFLMALQSVLFSPCKYGIIPEIVPPHKISHCNGIVTATTYLAIIVGTFLASFLTEVTHQNFVLACSACIFIACMGFLSSQKIEKTVAQAGRKKVAMGFVYDIFKTLQKAKKRRHLLTTLIFGAYFLFMGSYTQFNIIPFTLQSLHLTEVQGGYLFLMTALGIGLGSYLVGQLSGHEVELGFMPLAAFGIALCYLGLFLFSTHFFAVAPLLIFLGIFGGFYIVPIDAFVQIASPDEDRGQNVATSNFLSFIGVILASSLLAFLGNGLNLTAAQGFFVVSCITWCIGGLLLFLYADQLFRLLISIWARFFWKIEFTQELLLPEHPLLLVAPYKSWLNTLLVISFLPRHIYYIVPRQAGRYAWLYRLLRLIPSHEKNVERIKEELKAGSSLCLMQPVATNPETVQEWEEQVKQLLYKLQAPTIALHFSGALPKQEGSYLNQFFALRTCPIKVSFSSCSNKERLSESF